MSYMLHQNARTALHSAAIHGHIEVTRLLLDEGADVTLKDKVRDMIWDIAMVDCAIDCVPKLCDSNVIVKSTSQHQHNYRYKCHLSISQYCTIAYIVFLHIWAYEMRWCESSLLDSTANIYCLKIIWKYIGHDIRMVGQHFIVLLRKVMLKSWDCF